jgi:anaerobic ribonucleoside-triphosphate reductase activating protein
MGHSLRLNGLVDESIVDGPGLRYVLFTQGCPHGCPGCHNPETHNSDGGYDSDTDIIFARFKENPLLSGMTFSGGEPFLQPEALSALAESVKAFGKHLVVYTGYTCECLALKANENRAVRRLLELTDILIDGPYVEGSRNLELLYRGSDNQRVLEKVDIQAIMQSVGNSL